MKMLVTGAAGFIGSHLAERLAGLGHEVIGADNFSDYYPKALKVLNAERIKAAGVVLMNGDLRDTAFSAMLPQDIGYVFHLAAHPGVSSASSFADYFSNNILATKNLILFAKTCPQLRMFVNISTSSVYGKDATRDESAVPMPVSDYGVTKLAAEQLVLAEARNETFPACSLRLFSVYGPGERPDKLYTRLLAAGEFGRPFYLFSGSAAHLRSFTYVDDICDGMINLLGNETVINQEIINIGTDAQFTTQQGIDAIEAILGRKLDIVTVGARPGDQAATRAVIDKARQLIGYDPKTTLGEGLRKQATWFKKLKKLPGLFE